MGMAPLDVEGAPSFRRADAPTASSSKTRRPSSAANGGRTSATIAGASAPPEEGSIEESILDILRTEGSLITRDLRAACGFTGPKMRSRFDAYLTRLEMGGYIVTEDFVYPHDRHGREYGWGWSLLTTPEALFGREACHPDRTPQKSRERMLDHFKKILPNIPSQKQDLLLR